MATRCHYAGIKGPEFDALVQQLQARGLVDQADSGIVATDRGHAVVATHARAPGDVWKVRQNDPCIRAAEKLTWVRKVPGGWTLSLTPPALL